MPRRGDAAGLVLAGVLLLGLAACGGAPGPTGAGSSPAPSNSATGRTEGNGVRQTDDRGVRLPFATVHPDRWNRSNDGTTYEPCTALSAEQLRRMRIDPSTVRDAAGTNRQTLRGCGWEYTDSGLDRMWSVRQYVANSPGLDSVKRARLIESEIWRDDVVVQGRTIGVLASSAAENCIAYVQSGDAVVSTAVFSYGDLLDMDAVCDRALEFTRATIGQMPE